MKNNTKLNDMRGNKVITEVANMMDMPYVDEAGKFSPSIIREMTNRVMQEVGQHADRLPDSALTKIGQNLGALLALVKQQRAGYGIEDATTELMSPIKQAFTGAEAEATTETEESHVEVEVAEVKKGDMVKVNRKGSKGKDRKGKVVKVYMDDGDKLADVDIKGQGVMPIAVDKLSLAK
ncbi:hypothetical protein GR11A_00248 [Vibrio phage vB_VcorM_GR11A]|nr:hypothetical protein GR11A_00248 [Vibrio phage vB_VcorM_GR11A]